MSFRTLSLPFREGKMDDGMQTAQTTRPRSTARIGAALALRLLAVGAAAALVMVGWMLILEGVWRFGAPVVVVSALMAAVLLWSDPLH
jgi:hypothetical protein